MHRAAPLVLVALLASGCGGGSERLTRATYVRKADEICRRSNERIARLPRPRTPKEVAVYATKALASIEQAIAEERDLRPPEALEPLERQWLAQVDVLHRDAVALRDAAKKQDVSALNSTYEKIARDDSRASALAAQLGLKICSKP